MSSSKSYLNFDLSLSGDENQYRAKVTDSPAGYASLNFTLPFSKSEFGNFIQITSQNRSNLRSLDLEPAEIQSTETLGSKLFSCLLTGEIAERFRTSLAIADTQDKGLRIRLGFSDAPSLIDIPWELLFDSANRKYIGLSNKTPIIRKLDLASLPRLRQVDGCLQVLVMISSPKDHPSLNVEQEWQQINEATAELQKTNRIALTKIEPSLTSLQSELRNGDYHVFHYIGHGGFDIATNDGVLVLEDSEKSGHLVTAQDLGTLLHDESSLQLAFLNSCHGARTSIADPFAGVAQTLLQNGMPAVIAMQFEITDEAAITFSSELYSALTDGYSIEMSVAEARKKINASGNRVEWATPVLYTSIEGVSLINEAYESPKKSKLKSFKSERPDLKLKGSIGKHLTSLFRLPLQFFLNWQTPQHKLFQNTTLTKSIGKRRKLFVKKLIKLKKSRNVSLVKLSTFLLFFFSFSAFVLFLYEDDYSKREFDRKPEMVEIPAGSFMMGRFPSRYDKEKTLNVKFDKSFWMSKTEITFDQYDTYASDTGKTFPDDENRGRGSHPVVNVSWEDSQGYTKWLSDNNNQGFKCGLPNEAQWEYAAKAGSTNKYSWGNPFNQEPLPVASFPKNEWGLHDMQGNVWEWVQDPWDKVYPSAPYNDDGWEKRNRVSRNIRSGWRDCTPNNPRPVCRSSMPPYDRLDYVGFRVVCSK